MTLPAQANRDLREMLNIGGQKDRPETDFSSSYSG
jgi:hypothetical protein